MKIAVIASGYVGLVSGACLKELGNNAACLDVDYHGMVRNGRII